MTRKATPAEIIEAHKLDLRYGYPVRFRHFAYEGCRNGNTFVKTQGRAKLQIIDGVPHVRHHGKIERLTATLLDRIGGEMLDRPVVIDLRLDSEYLP